MKVEKIRIVKQEVLLSVKFEEHTQDELARVFAEWNDVSFLDNFFNSNKADLNGDFYGIVSIEEAVFDTLGYVQEFRKRLNSHMNGENGKNLNQLFKPYDNNSIETVRERSKARGAESRSWLRLYAIKLDNNLFVITGGAIKLTRSMERLHLEVEDRKMKTVKNYFKAEHIDSRSDYGFIDLE
ncbi:hypothetical protein LZG74_22865 [Dyadobacter sp. CY327]|uniref:hypothetical protein n=1 Tax=Dyadobacter sp. CY327 TaxID=2907301 RepID=UPI001F46C69A|nr:hypothetical protein [Dyadobacter sp. CY327]MCE7073176.1 hypothetical protein [Dyadobacter sp. CY327]